MKSYVVFVVSVIVAFALLEMCVAQPATEVKHCPQNEEFWSCAYSCQIRCDNYQNPGFKQQIPERHRCPGDCYCKKGLARNTSNICIPIEQC